jgi:hypothetical protein
MKKLITALAATMLLSTMPLFAGNCYPYDTTDNSFGFITGSYNGGFGEISSENGLPRTNYVRGYCRDNGTYVQPYYRSR